MRKNSAEASQSPHMYERHTHHHYYKTEQKKRNNKSDVLRGHIFNILDVDEPKSKSMNNLLSGK